MMRALTGTPLNNVVMTIAAVLSVVACDINPQDAELSDDAIEIWGFDADDEQLADLATTDAIDLADAPLESSVERETDEPVDARAVCELRNDAPEDLDAVGHCVDTSPVCLFDQQQDSQA